MTFPLHIDHFPDEDGENDVNSFDDISNYEDGGDFDETQYLVQFGRNNKQFNCKYFSYNGLSTRFIDQKNPGEPSTDVFLNDDNDDADVDPSLVGRVRLGNHLTNPVPTKTHRCSVSLWFFNFFYISIFLW